jgi:hypothetical protein
MLDALDALVDKWRKSICLGNADESLQMYGNGYSKAIWQCAEEVAAVIARERAGHPIEAAEFPRPCAVVERDYKVRWLTTQPPGTELYASQMPPGWYAGKKFNHEQWEGAVKLLREVMKSPSCSFDDDLLQQIAGFLGYRREVRYHAPEKFSET